MKKLRLIGFALGASMALAGSAFGQDIAIGVAGPMTGGEATFGKQMKDGAELAVADINAAGGVLGKKLKLEVGDDACDPKQARSVAEKMAGMKVPFVAGHYCSSSSIPASEAYAEGGVAGAFIAKTYKGRNIAILHDKTTYGKGLADETKKALNKAGGKEKLFEAYTKGDKDFNALVSKLKAAAIDVVYVGGYHQEAGLILRQMRAQGLKAQMISGDAIATNEFWSITGPDGEGMLFTFGADPRKRTTAKAVVDKFKAKNIDPEGYVLYTYAAVQVWAQAAAQAKTTDPKKVAETIHKGKWNTVLGPISYDAKGDITVIDYVFYVWKNGKYSELQGGS